MMRETGEAGAHRNGGKWMAGVWTSVFRWIAAHGWEIALLVAAAGVVGAYVVGSLVVDPDLWGHVGFGKDILASGLPEKDPYSYSAGSHPWINHEVGAEITFGWWHTQFGPAGLQILRYGLVGLLVGLLWREQVRSGQRASGAALVTALLVLPMGSGLATIRPHLFTYVLFLLVLICLVRGDREDSRLPWVVPPLIALWVNFHGGVLAGVGIVGLWWAAKVAASRLRPERSGFSAGRASVVMLASLVGLSVNPYGTELPLFLLETATVPRPEISEWGSVAAGWNSLSLWGLLTAGAAWVLTRSEAGRLRPEHATLLVVLALLPLLARRHLPLYALSWGVLLAPHVPDFAGRLHETRSDRLRSGRRPHAVEVVLVAVCLLIGAGGFAVAERMASFPCIRVPGPEADEIRFPQRAVRVLQDSDIAGDLATPYDWGEYAIWELAPDVRVGMDGRRETVYPDSVYDAYLRFRSGVEDWGAWLDDYGADAALVEAGSPPDNLLALAPRWREVHRDGLAVLYGRRGWTGTRRLEAASGRLADFESRRCFPDDGPTWSGQRQRPVSSPSASSD